MATGVLLALGSALVWGSGDFCGGGEVEIGRFGVEQARLIRLGLICTANCRMIISGGSCHVCNRCHSPQAFMSDRHLPTDGSNMTPSDFEGVSCSTCHRMVDPIYQEGISPAQDQAILAALPNHPINPGNASYIFDPQDRRRGPYALAYDFHPWIQAQFQRSSQIMRWVSVKAPVTKSCTRPV